MTDMSMISSLIDELNKSADEWNGSNMFELARMCSDAADTIWQLRDDLQRANAENAKLRELVADTLMQPRDYCQKYDIEYDSWDSVNDHLDARMRELGVEVDG